MIKPKIIIIPGNGDDHIETNHWYAWVRDELVKRRYEVVAEDMPDPVMAHANIWLPHIENNLLADENTVIIGQSSGAVAALRHLETHKLYGAIIIGTNYTDLGEEMEKESGYYSTPWQWDKIKTNAGWIVQFISTDDPYIPMKETQFIHDKLGTELHQLEGRGHFMIDQNPRNNTFPEIIKVLEEKVED